MNKAKIIGKIVLSEKQHQELLRLGIGYIAVDNPPTRTDQDEIISRIGDAEAIIVNISTPITKDVIQKCKSLRFIQTWSTGIDHIDIKAADDAGITVKNVPDYSTEAVAEKTIAMMLFIANQIREAHQDAILGNWNYTQFQGMELKGKTLGIIGKGKIGARVGELATAFGMVVLFADSKSDKNSLQVLCSKSDFFTLHCPLTERTYHLIGKEEFQAMKKGVYFVNNSRGGVVDEKALLDALNEGVVSYASIDVFEKGPSSENADLIHHPKVFVTPHIAWNTQESIQRLTDQCIYNLKEHLTLHSQHPLKHFVHTPHP